MTITETKGNALDFVTASGYSSIHYCNAQGKMDTGIARQIRKVAVYTVSIPKECKSIMIKVDKNGK